MRKLILLIMLFLMLISCGGRKQIEKNLHAGDYDFAIVNALKKLESNKNKKRKEQFINMLKDAYYKAVDRDLKTINNLKKDGNKELYKTIYEIYINLDKRQEAIKPSLPLRAGNKYLKFDFADYSNQIVDYRYKVSNYLLNKGIALLDSEDKYNARRAYELFKYIDNINPDFQESRELMIEAHKKGIDYVLVNIQNRTQQIIPEELEQDLLNFNTYGLNQFWTIYHAIANENLNYDYGMQLQLKEILISPDELKEIQLIRKKEVIDGWKYELDINGNVKKDTLGNDIKIDKIIEARARISEFYQFKSIQVMADVVYSELKTNNSLVIFPINTEFIFENRFARYKGDKRALSKEDKNLIKEPRLPFPSDAQMIFDSGELIKTQLKKVIMKYQLSP